MRFSVQFRQTALAGIGTAMLVVLGLSLWLLGSARDETLAQQRHRQAVLLANAVSAAIADAPQEEIAARLQTWKSGHLAIESIRVVAGRELVASTRGEDGAPRALQREERALFDLANTLRAAGETNRAEGVVRKKTLHIEDKGRAAVVVTVPYGPEGNFAGVVQLQLLGAAATADGPGLPWGTVLLVLVVALLVSVVLRVAPGGPFNLSRAAAVLVVVGLAAAFQYSATAQLRELATGGEIEAAAVQREAASLFARTAAGVAIDGAAASAWDTDAYGRPLRLISHAGEAMSPGATATEPLLRFVGRAMWAVTALGVIALLFFLQGYAARCAAALRAHASAYAYVAPAMIGMLVLVFFPFLYGIVLAFTDTTLFNEALPLRDRWIGLDNFGAILGDFNLYQRGADGVIWNYQNFYWTLMVTVVWTISNVTIGVSVGFLLALALNTEGLRGKAIYRVLLILPWAIPNYITALVWRGMFHPQFGVINQALQMFGLQPVGWFDGVISSFLTGLATNGWLSFPFMMVVILGALQSIPRDMYEAAEVEGATRWQQLKRITLPLLRPTLVPAVVLSVVWTFNMFNIIFLVSGGEPAGANEILITKAYKIAFENYQYGYAAAYSTVIFIILLVYGYFQTRLTKATESY
jgi:arabinogalactan oligomer/maltooligosaccharide transport system permease protein